MFLIDDLLVGGLRFVFDKVARAVDAELDNPDRLRERLLEAQMQLELGEIDEQTFGAIEADVLQQMRELRGDQDAGTIGDDVTITEVDIDTD